MTNVELLHREQGYATLAIEEDPARNVYWCQMHADLLANSAVPGAGRACFKPALVKDIIDYQRHLGERLRLEQARNPTEAIPHVVLSSLGDAFNLGGDLELFCRAIRAGDRAILLAYARECVRGVHAFHNGLGAGAHTIALVQGDALGGGFEAALSCHTIVAESGVAMGLPEVLFDLFPGMGAYSFLCKRVSPNLAEKIMLEGNIFNSDELYRMGLVDVLVHKGEGVAAVGEVIRANCRIPHARRAMHQVRQISQAVSLEEMMRITEIWVDTAMQLGNKSLRTMERLVKAQLRRNVDAALLREVV